MFLPYFVQYELCFHAYESLLLVNDFESTFPTICALRVHSVLDNQKAANCFLTAIKINFLAIFLHY